MLCSIVIRTYNRAGLVAANVRSALAQTWSHKEVIVVDDGSADNTREVLAPFVERGEITYHHQANQGLEGARLAGYALCQGEYFIFYDTGDVWDGPDYLEHAMNLLQRHDAPLGIINFRRRMEPGDEILPGYPEEAGPLREFFQPGAVREPSGSTEVPLSNAKLRELFIDCMPAPSSGLLMRRDVTRGAWKGRVRHGDDWMQALSAAVEHGATGVMETAPRWTKPITPDSTADGAIGRLAFLTTRIHDRKVMLDNFREQFTPSELEIFRRKLLSYELDCAEELLRARPRALGQALAHFRQALGYDARGALRRLPGLLRG